MKAIPVIFVLFLSAGTALISQVPSGFRFQAVARDQYYSLIRNTEISVTVGIRSGSPDGLLEWEEVHTTSTNEFGLFSLEICADEGLRTWGAADSLKDIHWEGSEHFLELKVDAGHGMVPLGTSRLLSVPYSMVSSNLSQPVADLTIQPESEVEPGEALFEVKRADGYPVFAVYEDGVWVYTDTLEGSKGRKGGFAVGGYSRTAKGPAEEYLRVTPDSTRVNVRNYETKGRKGGFAVGGYSRTTKGNGETFMTLNQDNYFIGHTSGRSISTGFYNSVLGYESGCSITTGESNAFIGYQSGYRNMTGSGNLFLGYQSGYSNTDGNYNTFLGYKTGYSNQGGINNTFLGSLAGHKNTEGGYNTFVGDSAGYNNIYGGINSFIGTKAGYHNTSGWSNVFLGNNAGFSNTEGYANVFIGHNAGYSSLESGGNVYIGNGSGENSDHGWNNIYLGTEAGSNNKDGEGNVFLGYKSGLNNIHGDGNIFIGGGSGGNETGSHKLIINDGYDGFGDSATVLIWGDFLARKLRFNSMVGIGVQPEWANLEILDRWGICSVSLKGPGDDYNYSLISLESEEAGPGHSYTLAHGKSNNFSLHFFDGVNYYPRIGISAEGNVSIGTWDAGTEMLDVNGNARFRGVGSSGPANDLRITADGTLTTNTSDARMKVDFQPLEGSLEKVLLLNGYTFMWRSPEGEPRDAGLIAQEVKGIFPEAVFTNPADGLYGINYSRFPALFVEAFKEQQAIIDHQKAEIERLKDEYDSLSARISELESVLVETR